VTDIAHLDLVSMALAYQRSTGARRSIVSQSSNMKNRSFETVVPLAAPTIQYNRIVTWPLHHLPGNGKRSGCWGTLRFRKRFLLSDEAHLGGHTMSTIDNGERLVVADLAAYRKYLKDITAIQTETVRRLIENDATPPMEMAAMLEDIANKFLDMSDEIRDFALALPEGAPKAETWPRAGEVQS
jgi:hypothetical protein